MKTSKTKQTSKTEESIDFISTLVANELTEDMENLFVKICSDAKLLAAVWADSDLEEGHQFKIARQAMEKAIEFACDSLNYDNLPEIHECWTWKERE